MVSALNGSPKFVSAQQVEDYRQQVEMAKAETREIRQTAQATLQREVGKFRTEYPTGLKFAYRFERDRKPVSITAMYHDEKFTYIQANAQETPTVNELQLRSPSAGLRNQSAYYSTCYSNARKR